MLSNFNKGFMDALVISFVLMMLVVSVNGCVKCECDPEGSLSSCQRDHCSANHEQVRGTTMCSTRGKTCCRIMCHGTASMCMPEKGPCMAGRVEIKEGSCKTGFKCCQQASEALKKRLVI